MYSMTSSHLSTKFAEIRSVSDSPRSPRTSTLSFCRRRTAGVSAAFIKELMQRIVQFYPERDGAAAIDRADVDAALDEMLFSGGSLNLKLLGAGQLDAQRRAT